MGMEFGEMKQVQFLNQMAHILKTLSIAFLARDVPDKEAWPRKNEFALDEPMALEGQEALKTNIHASPTEEVKLAERKEEGFARALNLFNSLVLEKGESVVEHILPPEGTPQLNIIVKDESYFIPFYFTANNQVTKQTTVKKHKREENYCELESSSADGLSGDIMSDIIGEPPKKRMSSEEDRTMMHACPQAAVQEVPGWIKEDIDIRRNSTIFISGPDTDLVLNIAKEIFLIPKETSIIQKLFEMLGRLNQKEKKVKLLISLCEQLESLLYIYREHLPRLLKFSYRLTNLLSDTNVKCAAQKKDSKENKT